MAAWCGLQRYARNRIEAVRNDEIDGFATRIRRHRSQKTPFAAIGVYYKLSLSDFCKRLLLMAAVANLLHNAFKFTQPHTEILLAAYAMENQIIIEVKDHCGGLGMGVAENIFLPFSQAGENRTGIGLGLTIARQSVSANGGTLTVENLPSIGCVFRISLPRHAMPT